MRGLTADMVGKRFGHLVVEKRDGVLYAQAAWACRCDCGEIKRVCGQSLRRSATTSCGCASGALIAAAHTTHGRRGTKAYRTWLAMKDRCHNPRATCFARYGGRGITVCALWRESFDAFFAEVGDPPSPRHSIDRIDNDRGYEPGNCRWATSAEQNRNRRPLLRDHRGRVRAITSN